MSETLLFPVRSSEEAWSPPELASLRFHRSLPGYAPTPLRQAPRTAAALGIGTLWAKDESERIGLPSFKILGASWAVRRLLELRFGLDRNLPLDRDSPQVEALRPLTLVAATDGNHGRAVARVASWFGFKARIHVPEGTREARTSAIAAEGAEVVVAPGGYDRAVRDAAAEAGPRSLVVSDVALTPDDPVPGWVTEGYATALLEVDAQLRAAGAAIDLVAVQVGVGALCAAVVRHVRTQPAWKNTRILAVEPHDAACAQASVRAGRIVTLPEVATSIMAGLNCETPSQVAFAELKDGVDAFVSVEDRRAEDAMRLLHADGVQAGESGAAGVAGLLALRERPDRPSWTPGPDSRVLVLITEGPTDPEMFQKIVGGTRPRSH